MKPMAFGLASLHAQRRQASPPALNFRWPSSAASLEDYEERLRAMPAAVAIRSQGDLDAGDDLTNMVI